MEGRAVRQNPRMTAAQQQAVSELWDAADECLEADEIRWGIERARLLVAVVAMFKAFPKDHPIAAITSAGRKRP